MTMLDWVRIAKISDPFNTSVQDPDFEVVYGRIFECLWIGYRFPFNHIRIIEMK